VPAEPAACVARCGFLLMAPILRRCHAKWHHLSPRHGRCQGRLGSVYGAADAAQLGVLDHSAEQMRAWTQALAVPTTASCYTSFMASLMASLVASLIACGSSPRSSQHRLSHRHRVHRSCMHPSPSPPDLPSPPPSAVADAHHRHIHHCRLTPRSSRCRPPTPP